MAIESVESILPECNAEAEGLTLGQLLGKAAEEARQGGDEEGEGEDEEEQRRREKELEEREKEQQELLEAQAKRKEEEERARERSTKGWTAQEAGLMTIGELYLMVGAVPRLYFKARSLLGTGGAPQACDYRHSWYCLSVS